MKKPNQRAAPAYQEFASDLLANRNFRLMSLGQRGLFWTMRLECWANNCVPATVNDLSRVLNVPLIEVEKLLTPKLMEFFYEAQGQLYCGELERYRENLEARRQALSDGGRAGGLRTQDKNRQARLEGRPKPLSRVQVKESEQSKSEPNKESTDSESHKEWIAAYDATPNAHSSGARS